MRLWDIEQIKQLKSRYARLMDQKNWPEFGRLFVDDAQVWVGEHVTQGRDEIVAAVSKNLAGRVTLHLAQLPEINILSPTSARGTWSMQSPFSRYGFAYYEDEYEKHEDGQWRFRTVRLVLALGETHVPYWLPSQGPT